MVQRGLVGRFLLVAAVSASLALPADALTATGALAVGDFGVGGTTERAMGAAMRSFEASHPASVLVTLGDNDYTESPTQFNRNWLQAFGWPASAGLGIAGTLGNHDVRVDFGRYEFDELDMPRSYYRHTVGNIDFFLLNSNVVGPRQTAWLERALAGSTARWKVVAFHHPAFTCGEYRSHAGVRTRWVPLFERYGVDLVLSGHDHNYQRFIARRGVRYVVHGGGGARLYPIEPCPAGYPRRLVARSVHGFVYLLGDDIMLRGYAVGPAGGILDRFRIYP
jgi:3',5'-cyclic AMP phosphodiesterase CpdA